MKKNINKTTKTNKIFSIYQAVYEKNPVKISVVSALCVGMLIYGLGFFIAWSQVIVAEKARQTQMFSQQYAAKAVSNVSTYMGSLYAGLAFFTQNSQLESALNKKDEMALKNFRRAVLDRFPKAEGIRFIPLGMGEVNLDAALPLKFSDLQMIRSAERREDVTPEAVKIAKQWRLNFVVPIPSDTKKPVVGTLLMTLPMGDLYSQLSDGLKSFGHIKLEQLHQGKVVTSLHQAGKAGWYEPITLDVEHTPWRITYTPSDKVELQGHIDYAIFAIIAALFFLLIIACSVFWGIRIGRSNEIRLNAITKTMRTINSSTDDKSASDMPAVARDVSALEISKEDEELLGGNIDAEQETELDLDLDLDLALEGDGSMEDDSVPANIFREYDIRGLFKSELTIDLAMSIGKALGSEALEKGEKSIVVGRDPRTHSPILSEYLIRGILSTGCDVANLGTVPTPLVYYATHTLDFTSSGVMVTASHNPADYNGFKVVMDGQVRSADDIKAIRARIIKENFNTGIGREESHNLSAAYIEKIFSDVALAGDMNIVLDAGNGAVGNIAPELFEQLGCDVTALYCDFDGSFPNRDPDPSVEGNLEALINKVKQVDANLGVAFDGDGDRLVVVTPQGKIIWPDRLLMLFAKDILARNPGADVVFDVKCSRHLNQVIVDYGGRPIMWKTGHSLMKSKIQEVGALLGGEYSGHIFIKDRWFGFDDAMYVAARLIEIISLLDEDIDTIFEEFPESASTPEIRVPVADDKKFKLVEELIAKGNFGEAKMNTLDGLRVDFVKGWGLVRASNTSPNLTLRLEADDEEALHSLKALFTRELRSIDNTLQINW